MLEETGPYEPPRDARTGGEARGFPIPAGRPVLAAAFPPLASLCRPGQHAACPLPRARPGGERAEGSVSRHLPAGGRGGSRSRGGRGSRLARGFQVKGEKTTGGRGGARAEGALPHPVHFTGNGTHPEEGPGGGPDAANGPPGAGEAGEAAVPSPRPWPRRPYKYPRRAASPP